MIEVIPSLPALTFEEFRTKVGMVKGLVSAFQIDICDGMFTPQRSWPMNPGDKPHFESIVRGKEKLPFVGEIDFEVHFMAHTPEKLIPDWLKAGATRFLIHIEAKHDFAACRRVAGEAELGVSLNIGTDVARIADYAPYISVVQLMGIAKIGAQGQPFDPRVLDMIAEVKARYPNVIIEVDGSVNMETAPSLVKAGATRLAPGSYVFRSENPKAAIDALKAISK